MSIPKGDPVPNQNQNSSTQASPNVPAVQQTKGEGYQPTTGPHPMSETSLLNMVNGEND